MTTQQTEVVEQEIRVEASPEAIFPYFTDPEKMLRWKGVTAELDPRPGGIYRVDMGQDIAKGEYVSIEPYSRLVFTWGWESEGNPVPPGSSTVEVTLTPDGTHTVVKLRHSGLPAEARQLHGEGWVYFMSRLIDAAEGREPGEVQFGEGH